MAKSVAIVEIVDPTVQIRNFGDKIFKHQDAFLRAGEGESMLVRISVERDAVPHAAGRYYIGGGSFERDRNGRIALKPYVLELIPVQAQAPSSK